MEDDTDYADGNLVWYTAGMMGHSRAVLKPKCFKPSPMFERPVVARVRTAPATPQKDVSDLMMCKEIKLHSS